MPHQEGLQQKDKRWCIDNPPTGEKRKESIASTLHKFTVQHNPVAELGFDPANRIIEHHGFVREYDEKGRLYRTQTGIEFSEYRYNDDNYLTCMILGFSDQNDAVPVMISAEYDMQSDGTPAPKAILFQDIEITGPFEFRPIGPAHKYDVTLELINSLPKID
jgi:hypothetical protein